MMSMQQQDPGEKKASAMATSLKWVKTGLAMPTVSCLCKELELTPEQFAQVVQKYRRQPRVILKSETEANKVILVGQDGVGKDAAMMEDILQGTIKVDGLSIPRLISKNKEYFLMLKEKENLTQRLREKERRIELQRN